MSIAGIAAAELEGGEEAPLGVKVQLAAGADPEWVGREVERVLAEHGMRSHRTAPPQGAGYSAAPDAGATTGAAPRPQPPAATGPAPEHPPPPGPPPPPGAAAGGAVLHLPGVVAASVEPEVAAAAPPERLDSVAIEEGRDGIAVRVTSGALTATHQVADTPNGMDAAIVAAVCELLGVEADLVTVQRGDADDTRIVTVLVAVAGSDQRVGSAVIGAGEAFAVAQAVWRALTAPD